MFTKKYVHASADAFREDIPYEAKRVGNEFYGSFTIPGYRGSFYLVESEKKDPIEMSQRLLEHASHKK